MLRIDFASINVQIYQTIENYIFYINAHLKIVKYQSNRIEFTQPNIIGFDHLLDIYLYSEDEKVRETVLCCLINIFKTQLNFANKTAESATNFYYRVIVNALEQTYQRLVYQDGSKALLLMINFVSRLFKEVTSGSNELYSGLPLIETIEIHVCDKRYASNSNKVMIQINRYAKLKDLKYKLTEKFWLEPDKIDLLTKGQFLKGDEKLLKDLNIVNNQTIMILEKNAEEEQWNTESQQNHITVLKDIFTNMEEAFLIFVLKECNQKIEDAIEILSDEARQEELFRKFKRNSLEVEKTFVKETFKSLFIERFSSLEFYKSIFKIANLKNNDIQSQTLILIKQLKPNQLLVQNIENYISNIMESSWGRFLEGHDLSNFQKEPKLIDGPVDDALNFDIEKIISNPNPLNLYKFEVFVKMYKICYSKEEETKLDRKFELQKKFIDNNGPELLKVLYSLLSEEYKLKPDANKISLLTLLSTILSDYILAFYLINSQDPYKKTKQIFFHRDKAVKKDSYMNISLRKNYSTDNVFSQNQNVSFKTNRSPKSFATPGFQSPSKVKRYVKICLVEIFWAQDV